MEIKVKEVTCQQGDEPGTAYIAVVGQGMSLVLTVKADKTTDQLWRFLNSSLVSFKVS